MKTDIRTIFLDFDGTLLDIAPNYHRLYCHLIEKGGGIPLVFDDYWNLKRHHMPLPELLKRSAYRKTDRTFQEQWVDLLETRTWIRGAKLKIGVEKTLRRWHTSIPSLVLITARFYPRNLHWQLRDVGLRSFFREIIVCQSWALDAKYLELRSHNVEKSCIIGDGEADMEAGRRLGIPRIAITTGIRDRSFLSADFYVDSIASLRLSHLSKLMNTS
jgi:phosphoglycolate phosphatase-like HAD superfamily hydrolase